MFNESSDSDSDDSSIIVINNYDENRSESDNDSDTNSDDEFEEFQIEPNDEEYDEIYQEDSQHVYSEKENGHYYIGLAKRITYDTIIMVNSVSTNTFFNYPFNRIRDYLAKYSILNIQNAKVHIMKLCILPDETYSVILKTHWIKLVQRHWKKVFKERTRVIAGRRLPQNRFYNEIRGRYPFGLNRLPTLKGMMGKYTT
jgi:hypothetical protein